MYRPKLSNTLVAISFLLGVNTFDAVAQPPRVGRSVEMPFLGIRTSEGPSEGLFRIESTGVSTAPVRDAARDFLVELDESQRKRTVFPADDIEWRQWDNRHRSPRQGIGFEEMNETQRDLAFAMLQQSLSAKGLKKTQDIMKLNGTLGELAKRPEEYNEWLYWITIMGEPSETKPWGWQLDGHHVVINYFVLGDQVVMSPVFMGSEPIEADSGRFEGTIVMQEEQDKGLQLIQMLSKDQQSEAILMNRKDGNNNLTEAYRDNVVLDYAGIIGSKLNESQRQALLNLIAEYVGNMREGHAKVRMSEVKEHLNDTYFAWIGGMTDESVYYYRVHSPVILIEFDHQRRVAPFRTSKPTRDHIHTVVRTPNGNDYGKDILRQHYQSHPH
ncbi:DUF3500 domain-containing protein [Rhodopirellula sp. JC740]|uniref:DUF3500 domain-containing protein n=1 Tax=Rhodopirellula halodulae TaxID=2894198 RepID=A0ABS8NP22_9BACT|nr:DUF3500 domain-containing protein [Rhodopirellula sp. JC740]MCC9645342.1 DUF3500 domain-containing protein [Rhodopirellula sp. JC740]